MAFLVPGEGGASSERLAAARVLAQIRSLSSVSSSMASKRRGLSTRQEKGRTIDR